MSGLRTDRDVEFFFVAGMATAGTRPHVAWEEFARWLAAHDAKAEAAVREQVAADIETQRPEMGRDINISPYREGKYYGLTDAARIAWGGTRA